MIITKDLSRLGRDYIKTGYYLENYFPEHSVRYVAINDGIDTFIDSTCNDITPFKAIMNDMYAKDISKKIRSVRKEKQRKGEYICTIPPYGYKKDPNQKNHLIVDDNVRSIVEEIFKLYSKGKGTKYISNFLNEKGIPSPLSYTKQLAIPKKWNDVTILNMMKNEVYIGNTVSNKKTKLSYKSNKRIIMDKEQYIITENTHEAIISKETYDRVRLYLANRDMSKKTKHDFLFRGLLTCHTCHCKLSIGSKKTANGVAVEKPIPYISCSQSSKCRCPRQHMSYEKFEREMLKYIKDFCKIYVNKDSLKDIYKNYKNNTSSIIEKYKREIANIENRITSFTEQIDSIYFDKLNKVITEDAYFRYSDKIISERKAIEERKLEVQKFIFELEEDEKEKNNASEIEKVVEEFLNREEVTKSLLYRLVDKIEIDENKKVYVFFTFSKLNIISETVGNMLNLKEICKRDQDTYYNSSLK